MIKVEDGVVTWLRQDPAFIRGITSHPFITEDGKDREAPFNPDDPGDIALLPTYFHGTYQFEPFDDEEYAEMCADFPDLPDDYELPDLGEQLYPDDEDSDDLDFEDLDDTQDSSE